MTWGSVAEWLGALGTVVAAVAAWFTAVQAKKVTESAELTTRRAIEAASFAWRPEFFLLVGWGSNGGRLSMSAWAKDHAARDLTATWYGVDGQTWEGISAEIPAIASTDDPGLTVLGPASADRVHNPETQTPAAQVAKAVLVYRDARGYGRWRSTFTPRLIHSTVAWTTEHEFLGA